MDNPKILIPVNDSPTTQKTIDDVIANRDRFTKNWFYSTLLMISLRTA